MSSNKGFEEEQVCHPISHTKAEKHMQLVGNCLFACTHMSKWDTIIANTQDILFSDIDHVPKIKQPHFILIGRVSHLVFIVLCAGI